MPQAQGSQVAVLVAQLCARVPGGTGRYTRELVLALDRHRPDDRMLEGVAPRGCAAAGSLPVPISTLPLPAPVLARLWERGLPPFLAAGGVVHAPTLLVPPARRGTRLVVTIHDVVPWTHPETLTERGVRFHRRMGERAAQEADLIVTPTAAVAREVTKILSPRARVEPVWLAAGGLCEPLDAADRRRRLRLPERYVLFVGTAEPRKGLDVLVEAMCHPVAADLHLVIVGPSGWGGVDIPQLAEQAGIAGRVHVTGPISDDDLAATYAGARVLAVPSRAEGFGLPVVEAMAAGVPVVVADVPALAEVAGGCADVVPVGDPDALAAALSAGADESGRRDDRIRRGRERAASFSWDALAVRMWQLYREF